MAIPHYPPSPDASRRARSLRPPAAAGRLGIPIVSVARVSAAIVSAAIVSAAIVSVAIVSIAIERMGLPLGPISQAAWM